MVGLPLAPGVPLVRLRREQVEVQRVVRSSSSSCASRVPLCSACVGGDLRGRLERRSQRRHRLRVVPVRRLSNGVRGVVLAQLSAAKYPWKVPRARMVESSVSHELPHVPQLVRAATHMDGHFLAIVGLLHVHEIAAVSGEEEEWQRE